MTNGLEYNLILIRIITGKIAENNYYLIQMFSRSKVIAQSGNHARNSVFSKAAYIAMHIV